jgi:O-antigen/teichoic acid export membrane protein
MLWPTTQGVVGAILLSELIPVLAWFVRSPTNILPDPKVLSWWDVKYAAKLMLTRGLSKTNKRADILMMGALATSVATAEYVIASKLAMLTLIAHQLSGLILPARIGSFIDKNEKGKIQREYHKTRVVSLIFSIACLFFAFLFGEDALNLFGNYSSAFPVLLILSSTYVVQVSFGKCGAYLNIAGYAGWTLVTTSMVVIINILFNYILIPIWGAMGASISIMISIIFSNSFTAFMVNYLDGINTYSKRSFIITAICLLVTLAHVGEFLGVLFSSLVLVVVMSYLVLMEFETMVGIFYAIYESLYSLK